MWGMEGPPNLSSAVKILQKILKAAKTVNVDMVEVTPTQHFCNLKQLLKPFIKGGLRGYEDG